MQSCPQFRMYLSANSRETGDENLSHDIMHSFQQMQLPSAMPILGLAVAQFTCTMLTVLAGRLTLLTALKFILMSTVCKATWRMLE